MFYNADVYQGVPDVPRGSVKFLRVFQQDAKTYSTWQKTFVFSGPAVSAVQTEAVKRIISVVPVEPDGSAYFEVPAMRSLLFAIGLAVVWPFAGIVLIALFRRWPNIREAASLLTAGSLFVVVAGVILPAVQAGARPRLEIVEVLPGLSIAFRVDAFGMLFALVASFLWIITSVYSIGYMRGLDEHAQTRYFCFFAISLSAAVGVAFSANLLTMYLFYEVLSLSTYPLVTHEQNAEARNFGASRALFQ